MTSTEATSHLESLWLCLVFLACPGRFNDDKSTQLSHGLSKLVPKQKKWKNVTRLSPQLLLLGLSTTAGLLHPLGSENGPPIPTASPLCVPRVFCSNLHHENQEDHNSGNLSAKRNCCPRLRHIQIIPSWEKCGKAMMVFTMNHAVNLWTRIFLIQIMASPAGR